MAEEDLGKGKNPMEEILGKLNASEVSMLMRAFSLAASESAPRPVPRVELPPIDTKLEGPASYLSWSRRVRYILAGKNLEGYLTGEKVEPAEGTPGRAEWKSTHMIVYIWLLSSMAPSIASTVDGIERVRDVWEKLKRTYDGVGNNLRVYQIKRAISAVVQGERTVQEYAIELERLWLDHDHLRSQAGCSDPACKEREVSLQDRTMGFLQGLAPVFEQRAAMLLAQPRIPSFEEAVSAMMQEESRIVLQTGAGAHPKVLAVSNSGSTGFKGETRECYNCGERGHLKIACTKPPKDKNSGGRGRGRGGRRGGGRGGYRANLMVAEEEEEGGVTGVDFSEEDRALLDVLVRKQKAAGMERVWLMVRPPHLHPGVTLLLMLIQPQVLMIHMLLPLYPPLEHQNG